MHPVAMKNAEFFFKTYLPPDPLGVHVVEVGSRFGTESPRSVCPAGARYTGVDLIPGNGVDLVAPDPYSLPLDTDSVDVCVTSSVFEHSEMFWVLFLELLRILKPGGLLYINAPSNGPFHRAPVDCWRFYPDSGRALVAWAGRNGLKPALLESYISFQKEGEWNDFVAVFVKDEARIGEHPRRILDSHQDVSNGIRHGSASFLNYRANTEDQIKLKYIAQVGLGRLEVKEDPQQNVGIDWDERLPKAHRDGGPKA